jgi:hypothetical protein
MDKKDRELAIINGTLSILGIESCRLEPREAPDFELHIDNSIIGIEVTEYHSDLTAAGNRPRRAIEAAWEELRTSIMRAVTEDPNLTGSKGRLEFKELRLPIRKEKNGFINQLAQLSGLMVEKRIAEQVNFSGYPLLEKYLHRFTLKKVCAYIEWSWNFNSEAIDINTVESQIVRAIKRKANHRYDHSRFVDIWLIISAGFRISQTLALLSDADLLMFRGLNQLLQKSHFAKVMLYKPLDSKVYLWPGWEVYE